MAAINSTVEKYINKLYKGNVSFDTTLVVIGTVVGSCKSNHHTITTTAATR
jgi:hypothetical protein